MKRDDASSIFKKTEKSIFAKNKLFLVFFLVILLVLISLSFISASCVDSDDGKNFYVEGVTTSFDLNVNRQDYCINSKFLKEYYCEDDKVKSMSNRCEVNCLDGVCVDKIIQPVEKKGFLNTLADFFSFRWLFKEVTPSGGPYGCTQKFYYIDEDRDGFGKKDSAPYPLCTGQQPPTGYVADNSDCDDTNKNVYPGATEICNGVDDNCDGKIDEEACQCNDKKDNDDDTKVDFSADPGCTSLLDDDETDTPPGGSGGDSNRYHKACKLDSNNKKTGACEGNVLCKPANIQCPDECDNVGASDTKCIDKSKNYCGDGTIQDPNDAGQKEKCDKGGTNSNAPNAECRTDCTPRRCGDTITDNNYNEKCDKGSQNGVAGSGCTRACKEECVEAKCKSYYKYYDLRGKEKCKKEDCKAPCIFENGKETKVNSNNREVIFGRRSVRTVTLGTCSCVKENCNCGECNPDCNCGDKQDGTWAKVADEWARIPGVNIVSTEKINDYISRYKASEEYKEDIKNMEKSLKDQLDALKTDYDKQCQEESSSGQPQDVINENLKKFKDNYDYAVLDVKREIKNIETGGGGIIPSYIKRTDGDKPITMIIFYYGCEKADSVFEAKFKEIIEKYSNPKNDAGNPITIRDGEPLKVQIILLDLGCRTNYENLGLLNSLNLYNIKDMPPASTGGATPYGVIKDRLERAGGKIEDLKIGNQFEKELKPTLTIARIAEMLQNDPNREGLLGSISDELSGNPLLRNPIISAALRGIINKLDQDRKSPCIGLGLYTDKFNNIINFVPIKIKSSTGDIFEKKQMDDFQKKALDQFLRNQQITSNLVRSALQVGRDARTSEQ